ncbi:MAG: hypothetical protein ISS17_09520 [Bacteroidales bacterium]|nr:hypothetical protein [Bacteroidales bacterium]
MPAIVRQITIRVVGILTLVAILGFIANNSFYYHSHRHQDGKIISHAHPFNKSQDPFPFKKHKHSVVELFILEHVQVLFAGSWILLLLLILPGLHVTWISHIRTVFRVLAGLPVPRAPPALVV